MDTQFEETDIVVVGSGLAGLSAAITAAEAGSSVIVLEKMSYTGGNSAIAGGGYCSSDSRLKMREKLGLPEDSWQLHYEDTIRGGGYYNDPVLAEILAKEAPDGLNFLIDSGVVFEDILLRLGAHSVGRNYEVKEGGGKHMITVLLARLAALGVQIRTETALTEILCEDGRVCGVSARQGDKSIKIKSKAVILASGGFGRDAEMLKLYAPSLSSDLKCNNHRGATGEVIRLAQAIGAAVIHMSFIQLYPCAAPDTGGMDRFAFDCYSGAGLGLIYVNRDGERFVNELAGRDEVSNAQIRTQIKPTWAILNAEIFRRLITPEHLIERAVSSGRVLRAASVKELSGQAGLPHGNLERTIREHNEALATGTDVLFGKNMSERMVPLTEGPFYAIAQWPTIHFCMGGLKIGAQCEVLDFRGNPIRGLFAAGEVCGGVHGANRLAGNALTECVVFGRRAATCLFSA